jgi:hypothetical protein
MHSGGVQQQPRAILAMEKGAPGERVFADPFMAWKQ